MEKKKRKITIKDVIFIITTSLLVCGLGITVAYLLVKKSTEENREYYEQKVDSFRIQNANLSKGQIAFIGDSITDYCPLDTYYADLDKAVYNRGIGGDTVQGVIDRLQVSLYDIAPSKIVLMIGINDIHMKKSDDYILSRYDIILKNIKVHLPEASLYALSITPQNKTIEQYAGWINAKKHNEKAREINLEIEKLANKYNYTYVDLHSSFVDSEGYLKEEYSLDGIHLSNEGFQAWANILKPYLI